MKLISIDADGTSARMNRLIEKIQQTEDRKVLKLLSREWWREWFSLHPRTNDSTLHLPMEPNGAQGSDMQGSGTRQAEQLPAGICGRLQSDQQSERIA